jgi:hypothetical protein
MWKIVDDKELIYWEEAERSKYKDYRFYFLGANDTDYSNELYGTVYAIADNDDDYHAGVASLDKGDLVKRYDVRSIAHAVGCDYSSPEYDKNPLSLTRLVIRQ